MPDNPPERIPALVKASRAVLEGIAEVPGLGVAVRPFLSVCDQIDQEFTEAKLHEMSEGIAQILAALPAEAEGVSAQALSEWKTELARILGQIVAQKKKRHD